ncbi:MAG TPA: hypothetical protein VFW07_27540 [Parafilimonas sp.]|nr:hypothetical protein [Parafilimonas sp.]
MDVKPATEADKKKFSQEVHWAYGTTWRITRGILGLLGLKGLAATAVHFGTIYSTALIIPSSLNVAPPLKGWTPKKLAVDALHHAVYAVVAGLVYDALSDD